MSHTTAVLPLLKPRQPEPQAEAAVAQRFRASKAGRYGLRCCRRRVGRSTLGRYDGNVYEAIYDEARKSPLNGKRMAGWDKFSQVLDVDFLKDVSTATMVHHQAVSDADRCCQQKKGQRHVPAASL